MTKPEEVMVTEEEYGEYLDDVYGEIVFAGMILTAGRTMRELDPIMFRCGMNDQPIRWKCGECDETYDEEEEAQECCEFQCVECRAWFVDDDEAENCCAEKVSK